MLRWLFLLFPLAAFASHPASCEVYFSPQDQVAQKLIDLIDQETTSIKVAIYSMTHTGITKALIRAQERGVDLQVIVDPFSVKIRSSVNQLADADVPLFVWDQNLQMKGQQSNRRQRRALMHDKFCLLGDRVVWTGSFNFTHDAAMRHQENVVTIESRAIAAKYKAQFDQMKLYECRPLIEYKDLYPRKSKKAENIPPPKL